MSQGYSNKALARLFLTTALSLVGAGIADAQEASSSGDASTQASSGAVEDVIVTGTRTGAQAVQHTPLAITAFSAAQIQEQQINNVKDLVQLTPDLQVAQATASAEIFIRGIGSTNVFSGSDPDVTVQVDGVYLARPATQFGDFLDVERVEVLRGPQGTLYGRNAVGGTLNVISRAPSDDFTARAQITGGDYNLLQTQAYVSGALTPGRLQGSLSVNFLRHDGYIKNIVPGFENIDTANRYSGRGQLRADFGDRVTATLRADYNSGDEYYESYSSLVAPAPPPAAPLANSIVGDFRKVALNLNQEELSHSGGVSEETTLDLTDHLSLKSITAFRASNYHLVGDTDATENSGSINFMREDQSQYSEELTLNAHYQRFEGVAGAYWLNEKIKTDVHSFQPSVNLGTWRESRPHVDSENWAVFAQGTFYLTPDLHLTLGGRYTEESKDIAPDSFTLIHYNTTPIYQTPPPSPPGGANPYTAPASADFDAFTPKAGLEWQATPDALFYISATRGYKSGGFNYNPRNTAANQSFAPETIWAYEAGARTDWFGHRLRVNLTAFDYDYTGLQVQTFIAPGNAFISNAKSASVNGVELEVRARPISNLTLTSNLSVLNTSYGPFEASVPAGIVSPTNLLAGDPRLTCVPGTPPSCSYDASGNHLTAAPHFSGLVAAEYDLPLASGAVLYGRGDYTWQSRSYFDPTNINILSQAAYGLGDLAFGFRSAHDVWSAQVWVKNVADKQYSITTAALGPIAAHAGPPRTFGITIAREW
jgi:iron complex outermembrane receptor protein